MFTDSELYLKTLSDALPECGMDGLRDKTVLVTGSTGLIGTVLVDALVRFGGCGKVIAGARSRQTAIKRFGGYLARPGFSIAQYDLFKPFHLLEKCDLIIHLAANANPAMYLTNPAKTLSGLVEGTDRLLEYCIKRKSARFVYVSSNEVYGKCDKEPITEGDIGTVEILNSRSCYPMGKRAAETLCACYKAQYGVDFVVARACHTYGPTMSETDNRAASQFIKEALKGGDIVLQSDGQAVRSYIYVADCVNGILTSAIKGLSGEAYNVAGEENSVLELATAVADISGVGVKLPESKSSRDMGYSTVSRNVVSSEKLGKLGWQAKYGLKSGVKATIGILRGE